MIYLWVGVFGGAWAAFEILSRYKDEPFKVIIGSVYCFVYVLFNATLSCGCYYCLTEIFPESIKRIFGDRYEVGAFCTAAFAAPLFFRSRLFDIKTPDRTFEVGPGFLIDEFLAIIDRQIDRERAEFRLIYVPATMKGIDFEKVKQKALLLVLNSPQRLTEKHKENFKKAVEGISRAEDLSPTDKVESLGFLVLDLLGERFLKLLVTKLREESEDK